jgi:tetratricopeptide (TPR) repeat protein
MDPGPAEASAAGSGLPSIAFQLPDAGSPASAGGGFRILRLLGTPKRRRRIFIALSALTVLFAAAVSLAVYRDYQARSARQIRLGIAPFESSDAETQQIAESFRLELSDALSELPQVQVRSAHSLSESSPIHASLLQEASHLQLDAILFGRLEEHAGRLTLRFELVRGSDALHLASFEYTGTKAELASIRGRVQGDVYKSLRLTRAAGHPGHGGTSNPDAYDDYLRARGYELQTGDHGPAKALEAYQSAIGKDANFAKAYAGMATAQLTLARHGLVPLGEGIAKAKEYARRAIQIDPLSAEAHATLGTILYRDDWKPAEGEAELRQAIAMEPNEALYRVRLASLLTDRGQFDAALQEIAKARASDPSYATVYMYEMYVEDGARLFAQLIATGEKLVQLNPRDARSHNQLAAAFWDSGMVLNAIAEWRQMAVLEGDQDRVDLEDRGRAAFLKGGTKAYARVRLDAILHGRTASSHRNDFDRAEWYLAVGDKEKAMAALEDEVTHHDPEVMMFAVTPAYDGLHKDPRFLRLLAQVGLALPTAYPRPDSVTASNR